MLSLDKYTKWLPKIEESARLYLSEKEYQAFSLISAEQKKGQLKAILEKPIANFTVINELYFRAKWAEVLQIIQSNDGFKLLEVASGDADMIPQVMARIHPSSHYFTANMNKILSESLLAKTKDLPLKIAIIEDNASAIDDHIGQEVIDIIAFQHSINDVIQAILCEQEGVDTVYSDWMETLPKMIELLQKEIFNNTFEQHVKAPFLKLINGLLKVLKKDGFMVMSHYMFQLDLDWGYPLELFANIIPITREWIKELENCQEVFFKDFHSHWWIFLQKR